MGQPETGSDLRLADLLDNPGFLVYQIHLGRRELGFLEVTRRTYDESSFLDDRIAHTLGRLHGVDLDDLARLMERVPRNPRPVHFLAHTSFCCSTLLARSLRFEHRTLVLREPLILRLLGDARRHGELAGTPAQQRGYLDLALRLLNKSFGDNDRVVVKPANLANVLLEDWLSLQPRSRGVVLTSGLDDFLLSTRKKPAATLDKMPWVAEALGRDTDYLDRLPWARDALEDPLHAAAVAWHAQRYALERLIERHSARLLPMDQNELLAHPGEALAAVCDHLDIDVTGEEVTRQAHGPVWHRHAKDPRLHYDWHSREIENARIGDRFGEQLDRALDWARHHLLEALPVRDRLPGSWQPRSGRLRRPQGA